MEEPEIFNTLCNNKKQIFRVCTKPELSITLEESVERKETVATVQKKIFNVSPNFVGIKKTRDPLPSKLIETTAEDKEVDYNYPKFKDNELRKILNRVPEPLESKIGKVQILYMNIQNKYIKNKQVIDQILETDDPPDIIALHEVNKNTTVLYPQYRTNEDTDGKTKFVLLSLRTMSTDEFSVSKEEGIPKIKIRDEEIFIVHTLYDGGQHLKLPKAKDNRTILGDFNIPSNRHNAGIINDYKYASFEAKYDVGIASNKRFTVSLDNISSDHLMLRVWLDIKRPRDHLILNKRLIDNLMEQMLLNTTEGKIYRHLQDKDYIKNKYQPVKVTNSFKKFWQIKELDIRSIDKKFLPINMLDPNIKKEIENFYDGDFRGERTFKNFDETDAEILRLMLMIFFLYPKQTHYKSNARDFSGISYNNIVDIMYKKQDSEFWAKRLIDIWSNTTYVVTKMYALKKRFKVQKMNDIRFIAVQDSFMRLYEEVYKPLLFDIQYEIANTAPAQYGFQPGVKTVDLINAMISKRPLPGRINYQILVPDVYPEDIQIE